MQLNQEIVDPVGRTATDREPTRVDVEEVMYQLGKCRSREATVYYLHRVIANWYDNGLYDGWRGATEFEGLGSSTDLL